jgi:hypothetical protein
VPLQGATRPEAAASEGTAEARDEKLL